MGVQCWASFNKLVAEATAITRYTEPGAAVTGGYCQRLERRTNDSGESLKKLRELRMVGHLENKSHGVAAKTLGSLHLLLVCVALGAWWRAASLPRKMLLAHSSNFPSSYLSGYHP